MIPKVEKSQYGSDSNPAAGFVWIHYKDVCTDLLRHVNKELVYFMHNQKILIRD